MVGEAFRDLLLECEGGWGELSVALVCGVINLQALIIEQVHLGLREFVFFWMGPEVNLCRAHCAETLNAR
jgi:hypothetical protein